jgi:hypothetical protein
MNIFLFEKKWKKNFPDSRAGDSKINIISVNSVADVLVASLKFPKNGTAFNVVNPHGSVNFFSFKKVLEGCGIPLQEISYLEW